MVVSWFCLLPSRGLSIWFKWQLYIFKKLSPFKNAVCSEQKKPSRPLRMSLRKLLSIINIFQQEPRWGMCPFWSMCCFSFETLLINHCEILSHIHWHWILKAPWQWVSFIPSPVLLVMRDSGTRPCLWHVMCPVESVWGIGPPVLSDGA